MIRLGGTKTVTKQLLLLICLCSTFVSFLLHFVSIAPDRLMANKIPQSNLIGITVTRNQTSLVTRHHRNETENIIANPSNHLQSCRFDLIVKMVYAYFYVFKKQVPRIVQEAYAEHLRVWNHFKEYCSDIKKFWFDGNIPCRQKRNEFDFVLSFHKTIDSIKNKGFNSRMSRIPLDKMGFLLNGAHRISASVILSRNASFEHHNYRFHSIGWGYRFFKGRGMLEKTLNMVMLEWMNIQIQLPYLKTLVYIVSVFSNNRSKDETMREIVKKLCSKDNDILYEIGINFTKSGMRQLITHMYGQQTWVKKNIQERLSKFNSTCNSVFLFVYVNNSTDLVDCKYKIRKLYNDTIFKSTVHIPDTIEQNLVLAEMILNQNSIQFMNYAKNAHDCNLIAKEVTSRSSVGPVSTLRGINIGRDDVMIDSGTVLGFFDLRKRTDVDLLFLRDIDRSILGNRNGIAIQAHAFKTNFVAEGRVWGEYHFCASGAKDRWDLFYDPYNFGYCYGMKFVSLKQLVRYKLKRQEPIKDAFDVKLINSFLNSIRANSYIS